jgi:Resolvase, N terminal domain
MSDIEARRVDIVVVYKIDRLTRSLMDFTKLIEVFDRNAVTFVSVTSPLRSSSARSPESASGTRSRRPGGKACGWAADADLTREPLAVLEAERDRLQKLVAADTETQNRLVPYQKELPKRQPRWKLFENNVWIATVRANVLKRWWLNVKRGMAVSSMRS